MVILNVCSSIRADNPVDHQRKILTRMFWPGAALPLQDTQYIVPAASFSRQMIIRFPSSGSQGELESKENKVVDDVGTTESVPLSSSVKNDLVTEDEEYSLDSYVSLSLSSGGRDAEGAESNAEKSASKLDLLQQLLRLAPPAVENGSYDKCNHPLHSWICNKAEARVITTTSRPSQEEFFPGASFDQVQILIPDVEPTTSTNPPPTTTARARVGADSWHGMDPCSHPFHSWMCNKHKPKVLPPPESRRPEASKVADNFLLPPIEVRTTTTTTTAPIPTTTPRLKSGWDGADPCTHPFHSWLCGKPPAVRGRTTLRPTTTTTSTTTIPPPLIPDASFFIPDTNPVPSPTPTTTSSTTQPSILIRTMAPKKGWDEADSCSHPFHSWLCAKPKVKTTRPTGPPPPPPPPSTTTLPPPTEGAVVFEPAPSNNDRGNLLVPDVPAPITTTAKPVKGGWDEADSCSHPFHSWLCAKPQTRTTRPPSTERPPPSSPRTLPPPPPPPQVENFPIPDATNVRNLEITIQKPVPKTHGKGSWEGADPCTHPFHSWLCNRSPSVKQNLKSASLRIGRQSTGSFNPEQVDEEVESVRWENFESLRLVPSKD